MLTPSSIGADLKLQRADEYLTLLEGEAATFLREHDHSAVGHFEPDSSEYVFCIGGKPPPVQWGLTVSEIAHHLRSALDNLIWHLVLARGGTPKERVTQFPIEEKESRFEAAEKRGVIEGVSADDRTFIKRAQPYQHGPHWSKRHLLFLLRELNNVDKHRYLHIGFLAIAQRIQSPNPINLPYHAGLDDLIRNLPPDGTGHALESDWSFPQPVKDCGSMVSWQITAGTRSDDPAEIMRVQLRNPGPQPEMKMEPSPAVEVAVSDIEHPVTLADLRRIHGRVKQIIDRLRATS